MMSVLVSSSSLPSCLVRSLCTAPRLAEPNTGSTGHAEGGLLTLPPKGPPRRARSPASRSECRLATQRDSEGDPRVDRDTEASLSWPARIVGPRHERAGPQYRLPSAVGLCQPCGRRQVEDRERDCKRCGVAFSLGLKPLEGELPSPLRRPPHCAFAPPVAGTPRMTAPSARRRWDRSAIGIRPATIP